MLFSDDESKNHSYLLAWTLVDQYAIVRTELGQFFGFQADLGGDHKSGTELFHMILRIKKTCIFLGICLGREYSFPIYNFARWRRSILHVRHDWNKMLCFKNDVGRGLRSGNNNDILEKRCTERYLPYLRGHFVAASSISSSHYQLEKLCRSVIRTSAFKKQSGATRPKFLSPRTPSPLLICPPHCPPRSVPQRHFWWRPCYGVVISCPLWAWHPLLMRKSRHKVRYAQKLFSFSLTRLGTLRYTLIPISFSVLCILGLPRVFSPPFRHSLTTLPLHILLVIPCQDAQYC